MDSQRYCFGQVHSNPWFAWIISTSFLIKLSKSNVKVYKKEEAEEHIRGHKVVIIRVKLDHHIVIRI